MQQATESRSKGYFRSSPSTAFDQYLQDIQKLPLIQDAEEERRLARRAQKAGWLTIKGRRYVLATPDGPRQPYPD